MFESSALIAEHADWSAPEHVHAFTTTRFGGVSQPPYDSFNLGTHVGDETDSVARNRARLRDCFQLPTEPVWIDQVHGDQLLELAKTRAHTAPLIADGAFTGEDGVVCAVLTADCLPLFFSTLSGDRVAVVHAGWRGVANGIIEKAVATLVDDPSQLVAWAGPCIGPSAFEIGLDVKHKLGGPESAYIKANAPDKVYANLYQVAGTRLADVGVRHFSHSSSCTYRDSQRYFSYRRDGECGRMASVIWMQR